MILTLKTVAFAKEQYGFPFETVNTVFAVLMLCTGMVYTGAYLQERQVYRYRVAYYQLSEVLPADRHPFLRFGVTDEIVWDYAAGYEHRYVPLEEFEAEINQ